MREGEAAIAGADRRHGLGGGAIPFPKCRQGLEKPRKRGPQFSGVDAVDAAEEDLLRDSFPLYSVLIHRRHRHADVGAGRRGRRRRSTGDQAGWGSICCVAPGSRPTYTHPAAGQVELAERDQGAGKHFVRKVDEGEATLLAELRAQHGALEPRQRCLDFRQGEQGVAKLGGQASRVRAERGGDVAHPDLVGELRPRPAGERQHSSSAQWRNI
mmetsp:Transcript_52112/g.151723  ORF Transcript_52112/g.151723 Transcript_52112/m.151723 type:complete len:213 (+) Transcript_52112:137-775(+)